MKLKSFFTSTLFSISLLASGVVSSSYADFVPSINFPTNDYMVYCDTGRLYGNQNEFYAIYYKRKDDDSFEVLKKTYLGNTLTLYINDEVNADEIVDIVVRKFEAETPVSIIKNPNEIIISDSYENEILTLKTVNEIVNELSNQKYIKNAEYTTSRVKFQTCQATINKYYASDADKIAEFVENNSKYANSISVGVSDYGDDYVELTMNGTELLDFEFFAALHRKTDVSYEIKWNDDVVVTGNTNVISSFVNNRLPIIETDDEENMKIIDNIFSEYSDLSDEKNIYVNPKYKVDFIKQNTERYIVVISGFDKNNLPSSRDEIFTTNLRTPVFSIWDKIGTPVYSGEIAAGQINGSYISIVTCIEDELPIKNLDCERMEKNEIPDYMLKYIFPNESTDNVPFDLYGSVSDATTCLGDLNSDGKADLTDLSVLSLYLLGDHSLTDIQKKLADFDGDCEVKLTDLAKYRQYLSKQINSLEFDN